MRTGVESRWLQLALLTFAVLGGTFTRLAVSPLQETMRQALALSDTQMALLQGPALSLPMVLASIPLGILIDRHSRVRILLLLALLCVLGSVATALVTEFGALFAARCVVGLSALAMNAVTLALITDLFAPAQRGRALMVMGLGQIVGSSAAFAAGGWLVTHYSGVAEGWRPALLWLSAPLFLLILPLLVLREPRRDRADAPALATWQALALLWQDRRLLLPLLFGEIMFQVIFKSVIVWGAPSLARRFEAAPDAVGAVMATALLISGVAGPLVGGMLADLCQRSGGARRTALGLAALAALSLPLSTFPLMGSIAIAGTVLTAFMCLVSAIAIMGTSLFTIQVREEVRGLGASLLVGASILFGGVTPVVVSALAEWLGGAQMIGTSLALTCAATAILGTLLYLASARLLGRTLAPVLPRHG